MDKRVVSKRTKRLFVGFGATGIAAMAIVFWANPASQPAKAAARPAPTVPGAVR